ncbi:hypothetical protein ACIA8R_42180 [Nonomuraea sp. NPDC051191]
MCLPVTHLVARSARLYGVPLRAGAMASDNRRYATVGPPSARTSA